MTLHYRNYPDYSGVHLGPLPAMGDQSPWSYSAGEPYALPQPTLYDTHFDAPAPHEVVVPVPLAPDELPQLQSRYARLGKRLFDITLALIALFLTLPVLVMLAAALWIEGGNPFYAQERLGLHGKRFRMWKLRTMVPDAEDRLDEYLDADPDLRAEWELTQKLKSDPRITPVGRLLRKTSMDELPQILNVLAGDMSLVGPRPMLPDQMPLYRYPQAYLGVRPGITGLWQVTARNAESFDLRAVLDLRYAQRLGFWRDVRIMAATFGAIWHATGY
ncbi:sugar transferase [Pararhodobacter oceanensis]|nr:sugar transferase [Pararhodobacter oceanensis]